MLSYDLIIYVLGGLVLLNLAWLWRLENKFHRFLGRGHAQNLEEAIVVYSKEVAEIKSAVDEAATEINHLKDKVRHSIQHLKTIRFNPFPDQGGNQSFSLALLDEERNGVVISSLYSRERVNVYAKPIQRGHSEYELSNEERETLRHEQK